MPAISGTTAALLAAGIGAGGSIAGAKLASRKSQEEKNALNAASSQAATEAELAKSQIGRQNLVNPAGQSAIDYYTKLLSGDRNLTAGLLAPTIQNLTSQYGQGRNSILASLGPGGVRDKALAMLDAGRVRDVGNLFTQAQPEAASALANIFSNNQVSSGSAGLNALTSLASIGANRGSNLAGIGTTLGTQLGSIFFPPGGRTPTQGPAYTGMGSKSFGDFLGGLGNIGF